MDKWEMVRLGDVFHTIRNGASIKQGVVYGGIPITRIETIFDGNINRDKMGYAGIDDNKYENYFLQDGDILMSHINSEKHLGKVALYNKEKGEDIIHGMNLLCLKANSNSKKYFLYALRSNYFRNQLPNITKKSVNQASFTVTALKELKIPLPSLEIQEQIARNLDLASELVKLHKTKLEELDKLIQSVFYDMFGDPVTNEMGWEVEKLGDLGYLGRGVSKHRPRNAPELLGGDYPLIQTGEVANSGIYISTYQNTYSEIGLKQSKLWDEGTLCITIAANIAKTSILTFKACFPDSIVGFVSDDRTNQLFVYTWFGFFQRILEEQAPQSAQKNINLAILSDLKVIVPPLPLQQKFANIVTEIEKQKTQVQQALDEAEMLYNSLMQEYFE